MREKEQMKREKQEKTAKVALLYSDEQKIERDREKEGAAVHKPKVEQEEEEEEKRKRAEQMRGEIKRVVYVQYIVGGAGGCQDNKDLTRY